MPGSMGSSCATTDSPATVRATRVAKAVRARAWRVHHASARRAHEPRVTSFHLHMSEMAGFMELRDEAWGLSREAEGENARIESGRQSDLRILPSKIAQVSWRRVLKRRRSGTGCPDLFQIAHSVGVTHGRALRLCPPCARGGAFDLGERSSNRKKSNKGRWAEATPQLLLLVKQANDVARRQVTTQRCPQVRAINTCPIAQRCARAISHCARARYRLPSCRRARCRTPSARRREQAVRVQRRKEPS